jgi:hypothetical protein
MMRQRSTNVTAPPNRGPPGDVIERAAEAWSIVVRLPMLLGFA